ncbi:MAG: rhodanese-like domain-containing protein [Polyangiaceae bacterium]|nr:rhodanese-like domain-containing protein [Polyangiaceae bacterium]
MAEIKGVTPHEVVEMLKDGYVYVDVRSQPEFEAGHVPGSLNVPLLHMGPAGMTPNPEFMDVMQRCFGKDEKLIIGCRSGGRSRRAAEMLLSVGYDDVADLLPGWEGTRDHFGRATPGYSKLGLPIEHGAPEGQRYDDVKNRKP